jgi:hypothetical protein
MLQNRLGLVLLDRLGHHVQDIVHHRSTQFQVIVRLNALLRDGLRDTLAVTALKLTGEEVTEPRIKSVRRLLRGDCNKQHLPSLEKRHNSTHEEQPYTPTWSPESTTRSLSNRTCDEPVVDQVFEVLRHAHLSHELVFVSIHPCWSTDVCKNVLQGVGQLEGVDIAETELDVSVDD